MKFVCHLSRTLQIPARVIEFILFRVDQFKSHQTSITVAQGHFSFYFNFVITIFRQLQLLYYITDNLDADIISTKRQSPDTLTCIFLIQLQLEFRHVPKDKQNCCVGYNASTCTAVRFIVYMQTLRTIVQCQLPDGSFRNMYVRKCGKKQVYILFV